MSKNKAIIFIIFFCLGVALFSYHIPIQQSRNCGYNCQVNELAKYYSSSYTPHDEIWIDGNEEFIQKASLQGWDGNGSKDNPFIITGYSFNQETQPLRVWNTNLHWIFIDNLVDGAGGFVQCGTWISNVSNGAIVGNEFLNRHSAIVVMNVENFSIISNTLHDNFAYGIEVQETMKSGNISDNIVSDCNAGGFRIIQGVFDSQINNNTITNCNGNGLVITGGVYNSEVKGNEVHDVNGIGILLSQATNSIISTNQISNLTDYGFSTLLFNHCTITENIIEEVNGIGIQLLDCCFTEINNNDITSCALQGIDAVSGENTTISFNTIQDCGSHAIEFGIDTDFFEVRYNIFESNGIDCQLFDEGTSNIVSENYYSDWTSPDVNQDGYVDQPYDIEGDAENQDPFPLVVAGVIPDKKTSTTTTSTLQTQDNSMELALVGGFLAVVIIFVGLVSLRRR